MNSFKYVPASRIDCPAQSSLATAKNNKTFAWKKVQALRRKVKDSGPWAGNLRIELIEAESRHRELLLMEAKAARVIERYANEQGLTTIKPKPQPETVPTA